ncbi:long-chain fatty acid--CoA ligase [Rhodobacterales bacterium]|nr:long-chain fatty acid--CoA ligase [Rhodobacterales bacterium]
MEIPTDFAATLSRTFPDATAFRDHPTGRSFTFAEINDRASRLANFLINRGLRSGDRVAVLCLNHPDFFTLLFAAQKTGIVAVPLNWRQPAAELAPVLISSRSALLFHDAAFADLARELAEAAGLKPAAQLLPLGAADSAQGACLLDGILSEVAAAGLPDAPVDPSTPWYLLYTSGTTGQPKAVIQTPRMAHANMVNYCRPAGLGGAESTINYLPLFHTAGINLVTLPIFLTGGCSTVLRKFDPVAVLDLIGSGEVTCFFGVPAVYQALALAPEIARTDFSAVRSLGCGGAPVPAHLLADFQGRGVTICNGMGMTETGPTVFLMDKSHAAEKIGSIGKPQEMTEVRLVDGTGTVVEGAGEGEMHFRGENITPGYMDNEQATAGAFTPDGWLKSGDIARRDEDGYFYIVDRIKDMFISGGENVYPAEVEKVLVTHPGVLEAVVIGVPDERWGEAGAAYLIERPGGDLEVGAMSQWCRSQLASYKIPKKFIVVHDLPRTAAGKVRKNILKDTFSRTVAVEDTRV